ncbi:cilia- and flagella-associated protein 77-like [Malaclemys terrapin pileata]|uniref:cilia- and flagella-associated protein 77-like n=1 Tax=Malaclemys terrapin pileata TaxID=2991368 RepID=UPI0023A87F5B|nr:cilia- and flagella-associated protein 77-like [Malaclemys terrapin pileata]
MLVSRQSAMEASRSPKLFQRLKKRHSANVICPPPLLPLRMAELRPGMENERVGVVRDTMLQNHLILKPELGKTRSRCTQLPGSDFVYGLTLCGTDGGVPEAIGHWNSVKPISKATKELPRDFVAMNRGAVIAGLVTTKEHYRYRQIHDIRRPEDDERHFKRDPPRLPDAMTYGMPARPSTPIIDVFQHKYKELWMEGQRAAAEAHHKAKQKIRRRGKVYETYSTLLKKYKPPMKPDPLWHLPHFEKVGRHLDTFPSQGDREKAFKVHQSEAGVRCGIFAQGIYTSS